MRPDGPTPSREWVSRIVLDGSLGTRSMIYVTRIGGGELVVNAELIETVEHTADTMITLVDGKRLVVATPVHEVVARVIAYRQAILRGHLRVVADAVEGEVPPEVIPLAPMPIHPPVAPPANRVDV